LTQKRAVVDMFLARIAGNYPVAAAWLYGSRARGDAREDSDADLAVILNGPKQRTGPVAVEMAGPAFDVMMETGLLVSPLPIWQEDWIDPSKHGNPWLIGNIKRDGVAW
jgi:uncharacterized protein